MPTGTALRRRALACALPRSGVRPLPTRKRLCVSETFDRRGRAGLAAPATRTAPNCEATLPAASVAITVAVNVPALAYACVAAAPVAVAPSPNAQLSVAGPHTSNGEAANAAGTPADAVAGIETPDSCGAVAS